MECQISHLPKLWMEGDFRNPNEIMLTFYNLMVDTLYILALWIPIVEGRHDFEL